MKIKLLQELNPSPRTLKTISSTHPYKIQITSGKINIFEPTNIEYNKEYNIETYH